VDENNIIIAGNQRYIALKKLGYKEVPDAWIKWCVGLTEEERKELIVIDNVSLGQFTSDIYDYNRKKKVYDFNIKIKDDWNPFTNKIEGEGYQVPVTYPIYIDCDEDLFNTWRELKKQKKLNDKDLLIYLIEVSNEN
jgi:hypothetical protein